jgi:cell division septation protein DedD
MALSAGGLWVAYNNSQTRAPGDVPVIQADQGTTKTRPQQPGGMAIPDQDKLVYNQGKGPPQVEKLLPPPEIPLPRPAPSGEAASATPAAPAVPVTPAVPPPAPPPAAPATAAPAVAAVPPPPAPAPPAPTAAVTGYRLQLGALRSEDAARQEWEKLKKAHGDLLGALNAAWPRADLGERGIYYRIQAGPVGDVAAAEHLCGELKRRNVGCILVRP